MKKIFILFLLMPFLSVKAEVRDGYILDANIYVNEEIKDNLNDNNYNTYTKINAGEVIKIASETDFNYIYVIYYINSAKGHINYYDETISIGENEFLHECIKLRQDTNAAELIYDSDVIIKEIYLFDEALPSWVQTWSTPYEEADIVLFSTHSDDEHLFFAGLIPTMINANKKIQVVYLANHNDNPTRLDEQLNGLWAVGLRNYPILGVIPDAYSESLNGATNNLNYQGISIDDVINYQAEIIKRFKPDVVVGHDEAGEYGHGQHILNTYTLKEALNMLTEEEKPYKVYLHLYEENPIVMNYDIPLEHYNGLTAFEVSKKGYAEHVSQHYTWFTDWLLGKNNEYTLATDIKTYSPTNYGLYYSKVGYENVFNDMFYNLKETINEEIDNDLDKKINSVDTTFNKDSEKNYYIYYISGASAVILIIIIFILYKKKH